MTNKQAFPYGNPTHGGNEGMSQRDYFAAAALQGICNRDTIYTDGPVSLAKLAYKIADAMLAAREA